jgi:hypothetical protein
MAVVALGSASAGAAPADRASDHVAIRAFDRYLKASGASLPASRRADQAFVRSISARCRNVLAPLASRPASSVNAKALKLFVDESVFDLVDRSNAPIRQPFSRLAQTLSTLRWSSAGAAHAVAAFAPAERRVFSLAPSDLCADARAFRANPHITSAGTRRWVANWQRANKAAGRAAFRLGEVLGFFHGPADVGALRDIGRRANRLSAADKTLERAQETSLLGALGIH